MANLNKVFLIGNLTRDPELRYTPGGNAVADLRIAVNQRFVSRSTNEQRNEVVFVDVTVWGKQAEACGEYLFKGAGLFVEGRLRLDTWESKEGQRRNRLRVVAQRVQFIGKPRGAKTVGVEKGASEDLSQEVPADVHLSESGDLGDEGMPPSEGNEGVSPGEGGERVPF